MQHCKCNDTESSDGVLGTTTSFGHSPLDGSIGHLDAARLAVDAILAIDDKLLSQSVFLATGILLVLVLIYGSRTSAGEKAIKLADVSLRVTNIVTSFDMQMYWLIFGVVGACTTDTGQDVK